MGAVKALVPVGGLPALDRVVTSLAAAGVDETIVVTGYHAEKLRPHIQHLGIREAHNPSPERGMFSSVRAGIAALSASHTAFFVLPVDHALLGPEVLTALLRHLVVDRADVVHPSCAGLRGHPPLLSAALRTGLLAAPDDALLSTLLEDPALRVTQVDVDDLTILLDMDTPEDLVAMRHFAALREDRDRGEDRLEEAEALYLLEVVRTPERVRAHCRAVASVGTMVAGSLEPALPGLDGALVRSACLLHDMVRTQGARRHALLGARILRNLGLPRLGAVVGAHMMLPIDPDDSPLLAEEEVVYLADKMVVEDRVAGLREREERALKKHAGDATATSGIAARMRTARAIAAKVEAISGRPLADIVPQHPSSACES